MAPRAFVDCHSHVVPSGDDGATSLDEGAELCRDAAAHGTAILFATPHVWPQLTLTEEREREIRSRFAILRQRAGLELRLGYELTPARPLLREGLRRYALEGSDFVLIEAPFSGGLELLLAVLERIEEQGLRPIVAHPERAEAVQADPALLDDLAGEERLVQVNSTSLLGRHGPVAEELGWELVGDGRAALVASDGHRATRPARLDDAFAAALERVGEEALALFDGSALEVFPSTEPSRSRAGSRGA